MNSIKNKIPAIVNNMIVNYNKINKQIMNLTKMIKIHITIAMKQRRTIYIYFNLLFILKIN